MTVTTVPAMRLYCDNSSTNTGQTQQTCASTTQIKGTIATFFVIYINIESKWMVNGSGLTPSNQILCVLVGTWIITLMPWEQANHLYQPQHPQTTKGKRLMKMLISATLPYRAAEHMARVNACARLHIHPCQGSKSNGSIPSLSSTNCSAFEPQMGRGCASVLNTY